MQKTKHNIKKQPVFRYMQHKFTAITQEAYIKNDDPGLRWIPEFLRERILFFLSHKSNYYSVTYNDGTIMVPNRGIHIK